MVCISNVVSLELGMNEQSEKTEFAAGDNQANDFPAIDWELFRATFKGEHDGNK